MYAPGSKDIHKTLLTVTLASTVLLLVVVCGQSQQAVALAHIGMACLRGISGFVLTVVRSLL